MALFDAGNSKQGGARNIQSICQIPFEKNFALIAEIVSQASALKGGTLNGLRFTCVHRAFTKVALECLEIATGVELKVRQWCLRCHGTKNLISDVCEKDSSLSRNKKKKNRKQVQWFWNETILWQANSFNEGVTKMMSWFMKTWFENSARAQDSRKLFRIWGQICVFKKPQMGFTWRNVVHFSSKRPNRGATSDIIFENP